MKKQHRKRKLTKRKNYILLLNLVSADLRKYNFRFIPGKRRCRLRLRSPPDISQIIGLSLREAAKGKKTLSVIIYNRKGKELAFLLRLGFLMFQYKYNHNNKRIFIGCFMSGKKYFINFESLAEHCANLKPGKIGHCRRCEFTVVEFKNKLVTKERKHLQIFKYNNCILEIWSM